MKLSEILKKLPELKRADVYYLVKLGFIGKYEKSKIGKRKILFSQRDFEKIRLMLKFRQEGLSWESANKKADEFLTQTFTKGARIQIVNENGEAIAHRRFKHDVLDIIFETNAGGLVDKIIASPDFIINKPLFKETADAVAEMINFLKELSKDRGVITEKNIYALQFLLDEYENFMAKHGKERIQLFKSFVGNLAKAVAEILKKKEMNIDVVAKEVLEKFTELERLSFEYVNLGKEKVESQDIHRNTATASLFFSGVFGWKNKLDKKATPGYTIEKNQIKLPETITISFKNLDNLLGSYAFRKLMASQISKQYELGDYINFFIYDEELSDELFTECLKVINEGVAFLRKKYEETFLPVQDSITFYDQGISLYTPSSEKIFIFATSSGLVIPEEYFGDVALKKNPYRKKYFDYGIRGKQAWDIPKFYQWDSDLTAKALWTNYQQKLKDGLGEIYKESAIDLLSKFLKTPNLEISEISFNETPWKFYLTLNTPYNILFSIRDKELKQKIAHGYLISQEGISEPLKRFLYENKKDECADQMSSALLFSFVENYYFNEKHNIIKKRNEIIENAKEVAREVIEMLIERGKKLEDSK